MSVPEKLLLHTCCAPCLVAPIRQLKLEGIAVTAYWFNPNIHPVTEYRSRLESLKAFAEREQFPLVVEDRYGLREFVRALANDPEGRCRHCYESRLDLAAQTAVELGCDAFSTTLLYSKYQKHDLIREVAMVYPKNTGSPFSTATGASFGRKGSGSPKKRRCTARNTAAASSAKKNAI